VRVGDQRREVVPQGGLPAGEGDRRAVCLIHDAVDYGADLRRVHLRDAAPAARRVGIAESAAILAAVGQRDLGEHRQIVRVRAVAHQAGARCGADIVVQHGRDTEQQFQQIIADNLRTRPVPRRDFCHHPVHIGAIGIVVQCG